MTSHASPEIRDLALGTTCFSIRLYVPRANALEPRLLQELRDAFDALQTSGCSVALLTGGRNFSSGGGVARFLEAARFGQAERHADAVVPMLLVCVLRMIEMPVVFALAARGTITSGAAGFLFASGLAVLAPDAFVQPYYATVGFAPDGGWHAVLPERIGAKDAAHWLTSDARFGADDLRCLGLAETIEAEPEGHALEVLATLDVDVALQAKARRWPGDLCAKIKRRLDDETRAFRDRIGKEDTARRMAEFLGKTGLHV